MGCTLLQLPWPHKCGEGYESVYSACSTANRHMSIIHTASPTHKAAANSTANRHTSRITYSTLTMPGTCAESPGGGRAPIHRGHRGRREGGEAQVGWSAGYSARHVGTNDSGAHQKHMGLDLVGEGKASNKSVTQSARHTGTTPTSVTSSAKHDGADTRAQ